MQKQYYTEIFILIIIIIVTVILYIQTLLCWRKHTSSAKLSFVVRHAQASKYKLSAVQHNLGVRAIIQTYFVEVKHETLILQSRLRVRMDAQLCTPSLRTRAGFQPRRSKHVEATSFFL